MLGKVTALLSALAVSACSVFGVRDTPEPRYAVVDHVGSVEIRQYGPRLAAETTVPADEMAARNQGFRRLFGYITGANAGGRKIDMTAPVAQAPARGQSIAMTAPVAQVPAAGGGFTIRFFMPAQFTTLASLPAPTDPSVRLVEVPGETVAVLRYSGTSGAPSVRDHEAALLAALKGSAWQPVGAPFAWFYDPPWTIPMLRRNEAVVAVKR